MAFERARLLFAQRRYEQAARELRDELAETPNCGRTHAFLGRCLACQGRPEAAVAEGEEAVRLAPDLAYAHHMLARTYQECDRLEEAEAAAREARRLAPRDADVWECLSWIRYRRGKPESALKAVNRGLEVEPQHIGCLKHRGLYLRALGDWKGSEEALRKALALDPGDPYAHANLGWTLWSKAHAKTCGFSVAQPFALACLRELGEALGHFRESLRLHPTWEWPRTGVAYVLLARRRALLRLLLGILAILCLALLLALLEPRPAPTPAGGAEEPKGPGLFFVAAGFVVVAFADGPAYALMLASRLGAAVLTPGRRLAAQVAMACLIAAAPAAAVTGWLTSPPAGLAVLFLILAMVGPLTGACEASPGGARRFLAGYAGVLAAVGLACLVPIIGADRDAGPMAKLVLLAALGLGSWKSSAVARVVETHFARKRN